MRHPPAVPTRRYAGKVAARMGTGKRNRFGPYSIIALPTLAFLLLGWIWAFASPPGSAADENFHLSSIWCAWGPSESCELTSDPAVVLVPERVAHANCFALLGNEDASCTYELTDWYTPAVTVLSSDGQYPPVYHTVMRVFVGPNVNQSVLVIRMANVALAAGLLALALMVARPVIRRAVALAWMVCLVPTGIFFIASVNASSWAITGGALFWAFLHTASTEKSFRTRRALVALGGAAVCIFIAMGARADSFYVLLLSTIAVAIVTWPHLRKRMNRLWLGLLIIPLAAIAWSFNIGLYFNLNMSFPAGNEEFDQPNALLKMVLELPSFFAGIVGGQGPGWSQRSSANDGQLPGFSWTGLAYGVGSLDVQNPEISGLLVLACVGGAIFLGFRSHGIRKVLAVLLLSGGLIGQLIVMRGLAGFQAISVIQPRYVFALVLVIISFAVICYPRSHSFVNRGQALLFIIALTIADAAALMATNARFVYGQVHAWTGVSAAPGWWWSIGPSPLVVTTTGAVVGCVWLIFMARLVLAPNDKAATIGSS